MLTFSLVVLPIAKSNGEEIFKLPKDESNSQNLKLLRSEMTSLGGATGGADIQIEENALIARSISSENRNDDEKPKVTRSGVDEISIYTVREGDTISQISEMFGVKPSTIRGFNDIQTDGDLKVGTEILVLPIDGVTYKVEKGDSISSIAKKFKSDESDILIFNDMSGNSDLKVGSEIIIPNAEPLPVAKEVEKKVASKTSSKSSQSSSGTTYSNGFYIHPLPGGAVKSQGFHDKFQAQDLAAPIGRKIVASSGGRVIAVKSVSAWNGGYGGMVIIDDGKATVLYAHMSKISVTQGQVVAQGEKIGEVGSTGRSTGPHLHIEYRGKNGPMKTPVW